MTPSELNIKFATKQAKAWGFKSIKKASDNGYNTLRVSCELREIADILNISKQEAYNMMQEWKSQGLVTYSGVANLDTMYFK